MNTNCKNRKASVPFEDTSQMTEINQEFIDKTAAQMDKADVPLAELPTMELYMEQMRQFINDKVGGAKRKRNMAKNKLSDNEVFSKAMINNYTKAGVLNPPKNKKYNRDHIIMLLLTNQLRDVLSISDIQALFAPMLDMKESEVHDSILSIEAIYDTYLKLNDKVYADEKNGFADKFELIKKETSKITDGSLQDLAEEFMTVMLFVAEANIAKRMAENVIDCFFDKYRKEDEKKSTRRSKKAE